MIQENSIAGALCAYFENCELLRGKLIDMDYLADDAHGFSVDIMPSSVKVSNYTSGGGVRQRLFVLRTNGEYKEDTLARINSSGLFEALADWMEQQTQRGTLPELPHGKTALQMEAMTPGVRYASAKSTMGQYQIQCRLTYLQD